MAAGDFIGDVLTISSGGSITIQPPSGAHWIIHNLYWSDDVEISVTDGSTEVLFHSSSYKGCLLSVWIHLSDSQYLKVSSSSGCNFAYDGVEA